MSQVMGLRSYFVRFCRLVVGGFREPEQKVEQEEKEEKHNVDKCVMGANQACR